jgi:hypothetical protein
MFAFWADPSKIGVSRIQCGLIDVVERDPSNGASGDILETVKDKLVLADEALWNDHTQAPGAVVLPPSLHDQTRKIWGMA